MNNPRFPSVDQDGKIRESHLPDHVKKTTLESTYETKQYAQQTYVDRESRNVFPYYTITQHNARLSDLKRRKGGVIGINGKSGIAFQIAHQLDTFKADIWPLFRERGIPVGWGVVTRAVGNPADPFEPTHATWDDVRQHFIEGAEVWSHSMTHLDPAPLGPGATVSQEISGSRGKIQWEELFPVGWQTAGIAGGTTVPYYRGFMNPTQMMPDYAGWSSEVGQLLLANYPLVSSGHAGETRPLPLDATYGLGFVTLDNLTLAQAKDQVNRLLDRPGLGAVLALHPDYIGMGGRLSLAELAELLDYVKQLWDEDEIECLTQSGLAFADPETDRRFDLLRENGFDMDSHVQVWSLTAGANRSVGNGRLSGNAMAITTNTGVASQIIPDVRIWGANGMVHMFEGWVRNVNPTDSGLRITFKSTPINGEQQVFYTKDIPAPANSEWTRFRFPVGVPLACNELRVELSRTGDASIRIDDVHMWSA